MSDANVKKENKRKKEPVRFDFQTGPIMFRHLQLAGRLESPFCDSVLKNANAIFCGETCEPFRESLVGNARTATRAGELPGSANFEAYPIPIRKT